MVVTTNGIILPLEFQPDAVLVQAAPVQNDWYPVLAVVGSGLLIDIGLGVKTADETLQIEIIIDGVTLSEDPLAAVANGDYHAWYKCDASEDHYEIVFPAIDEYNRYLNLPFRHSLTVRARKTTALGAGDLVCIVVHALY